MRPAQARALERQTAWTHTPLRGSLRQTSPTVVAGWMGRGCVGPICVGTHRGPDPPSSRPAAQRPSEPRPGDSRSNTAESWLWGCVAGGEDAHRVCHGTHRHRAHQRQDERVGGKTKRHHQPTPGTRGSPAPRLPTFLLLPASAQNLLGFTSAGRGLWELGHHQVSPHLPLGGERRDVWREADLQRFCCCTWSCQSSATPTNIYSRELASQQITCFPSVLHAGGGQVRVTNLSQSLLIAQHVQRSRAGLVPGQFNCGLTTGDLISKKPGQRVPAWAVHGPEVSSQGSGVSAGV